jgi:alkylated DNA repair dioxygenase AlkB
MTYDLFVDQPASPTTGKQIVIPDADILHFPVLFGTGEADALFKCLMAEIQWQQEKIKLYGQVHDLPRLTAWYGDPGKTYTYSGIAVRSLAWIDPLLEIKEKIEAVSGVAFNSVLLNRYRNGSDSVSWHADDERELGMNPVIGSVNFGEARPFQLKHKSKAEKAKLVLDHGSYLLMKGETQHHWLHQIPKSKKELDERINLTFRRIF